MSTSPNLCFLDVSTDPDRALELVHQIAGHSPQVHVVALLSENAPDFILRCLRQGAADFLLHPFSADQIEAAMDKLSRSLPAEGGPHAASAKIIAVMPAKGACGSTTLAANLAYQWKRSGAKRVLLVDLDPLTGTLSFLLKIKSSYSFLDVLVRDGEIDASLWKSMVTTVQGVDVMLAPEVMVEGVSELRDPAPVIDYARHQYDAIVLDTGGVYGEWCLAQARLASEVLLVTTNELSALQAAQRALSYLDANRVGRWKIRLVVNRYQSDIGLNREVIGTALHSDVFHTVPSDYEAVQRALMEGKPLGSGTAFGKAVGELVERLAGKGNGTRKASAFGGLLSLFSRTSS